MNIFGVLFLCFGSAWCHSDPLIFISSSTPPDLVEYLRTTSLPSAVDLYMLSHTGSLELPERSPLLLFDLTYSKKYRRTVSQVAQSLGAVSVSCERAGVFSGDYFLHPSAAWEAESLAALVLALGWESYHLLGSEDSIDLLRSLIAEVQPSHHYTILASHVDQRVYDAFTSKIVKPSESWKLIATSAAASKVLQSFVNARIFKAGCGLVFGSTWGAFDTGTVLLVEAGLEGAESHSHYTALALSNVLQVYKTELEAVRLLTAQQLREAFAKHTTNRAFGSAYSVVNYVSDQSFEVVGTVVAHSLELRQDIIYPGLVTEIPSSKPAIATSGCLGNVNLDGSFSLKNQVMNLAVEPMIYLINQDDELLKNFELTMYPTDCGPDVFEYSHFLECFDKHSANLGALYLETSTDAVVLGSIDVFRDLNLSTPHLGVLNEHPLLYEKAVYPEFIVPHTKRLYLATILPYILNSFQWTACVALFNSHSDLSIYDAFATNAKTLGIQILNEYAYRFTNYTYTKEDFEAANPDLAEHILATKSRVIVVLSDSPVEIFLMQLLYDLGLRKGDVMMILSYRLSVMLQSLSDEALVKVLELGSGSISLTRNEYTGEYGEALRNQIASFIGIDNTPYTCYALDSLMLGVRAIDMMLALGRDYEDPIQLNHFIRQQRFQGCSGTISIDGGSNGLGIITYDLLNFVGISREDWEERDVGYYTIGITIPLKISKDILWPDGQTEAPLTIREDPPCGFDLDEAKDNSESSGLATMLTTALVTVALVISFGVWWAAFRFQHEMLRERQEIMFEDGLLMALPVVEALQYIGLGPDFAHINRILAIASAIVAANFATFAKFEGEVYWRGINLAIGLCTTWSLCFGIQLLGQRRQLPRLIYNSSAVVGMKLVPVMAQALFIGIVRVFFTVFACDKGTSEDLTAAFSNYDCHTFCWTDKHLDYVIGMSVLLVVYICLAIVSRPVFELTQTHINVRMNPWFSMAKNAFQLVLLTASLHLNRSSSYVYVYAGLVLMWTAVVCLSTPYNYPRFNMWQKLLLVGVSWNAALLILVRLFGEGGYAIGSQLGVWLGLAAFGVFLQIKRYPSLLYRKPGADLIQLFKFQLTNRVPVDQLQLNELDYCQEMNSSEGPYCSRIEYIEIPLGRAQPRRWTVF